MIITIKLLQFSLHRHCHHKTDINVINNSLYVFIEYTSFDNIIYNARQTRSNPYKHFQVEAQKRVGYARLVNYSKYDLLVHSKIRKLILLNYVLCRD